MTNSSKNKQQKYNLAKSILNSQCLYLAKCVIIIFFYCKPVCFVLLKITRTYHCWLTQYSFLRKIPAVWRRNESEVVGVSAERPTLAKELVKVNQPFQCHFHKRPTRSRTRFLQNNRFYLVFFCYAYNRFTCFFFDEWKICTSIERVFRGISRNNAVPPRSGNYYSEICSKCKEVFLNWKLSPRVPFESK